MRVSKYLSVLFGTLAFLLAGPALAQPKGKPAVQKQQRVAKSEQRMISGVPIARLKQLGYSDFKQLGAVKAAVLARQVGRDKAQALQKLAQEQIKAGHTAFPTEITRHGGKAAPGKRGQVEANPTPHP